MEEMAKYDTIYLHSRYKAWRPLSLLWSRLYGCPWSRFNYYYILTYSRWRDDLISEFESVERWSRAGAYLCPFQVPRVSIVIVRNACRSFLNTVDIVRESPLLSSSSSSRSLATRRDDLARCSILKFSSSPSRKKRTKKDGMDTYVGM